MKDVSKTLYLVSEEKIKESIQAFGDFLTHGDAKEVLSAVGEVSAVTRGIKLVVDVRNWHMARKIRKFVENLEVRNVGREQFEQLEQEYGKEKVLENVILSLDAMRSEKQAAAFAHLFEALLKGELDWKRFCELRNILEKIDPEALDEDFNEGQPTHRLVSVGLAYLQTVMNGVKVLPNGYLYNDFEKFVVIPYRMYEAQK